MGRAITIDAEVARDVLTLIDRRAEELRAEADLENEAGTSLLGHASEWAAGMWEDDARAIREALGAVSGGEG